MPTAAEKRTKMGAKTASDSARDLIVPRLPYVEIPSRIAKAFPELATWHQRNNESLEQWREKVNIILNRANTDTKLATNTQIADLQSQIDSLTP